MTPKEEIKKEIRYIEKLEFNGIANYEHTNAIKKALNYYLDMNGATKEKDVWNTLGRAIEKYPNILFTHTADMIATRIMERKLEK